MKKIILLLLSFVFLSCSKNDEDMESRGGITEETISYLHNNSSKKWKITHYYSNYEEQILDEALTNCMKDDVYIFYFDSNECEVTFGDSSCYANYTDVVAETAAAEYNFYSSQKKLYLSFGRGAYNDLNVQTSWSITTSCLLLNPEKMIFTNGKDNSGVGIVFERI
ncbi:hypothetical protein [Tenacibaculum sp. IB213877]|uniref:hypothetical protein n=1 Tax=Tenacibaculum sp. IB213877 TaxID=3097351 RepID=UPI002A5A9CCE|nr:hypothetical protein [Tenacibaculum sp. IB213877]MDY0780762.1 hypothetical protein [Tenacibaculum sp. IB213877]